MLEKIINFNEKLKETTVISKRELCLLIVACSAAGIVLGVFLSPKRAIRIGCNNGNHNGNHNGNTETDAK